MLFIVRGSLRFHFRFVGAEYSLALKRLRPFLLRTTNWLIFLSFFVFLGHDLRNRCIIVRHPIQYALRTFVCLSVIFIEWCLLAWFSFDVIRISFSAWLCALLSARHSYFYPFKHGFDIFVLAFSDVYFMSCSRSVVAHSFLRWVIIILLQKVSDLSVGS